MGVAKYSGMDQDATMHHLNGLESCAKIDKNLT
jgi:hypothetical protein